VSTRAEALHIERREPPAQGWRWAQVTRVGSLAAIALGLASGALLGEPQAIVVALPLLLFGVALVWLGFRGTERQVVLTLFLAAFAVRLLAAVVAHYSLLYFGKGGFLLLDDRAYDKIGWTLARVWMGIFPGIRDTDQYLMVNYTYLVAGLYYFLGHALLAVKMMNVLFGSLLAVVTYALGRELFGPRVGLVAGILTAFFPSLVAWSAINLKDILVVLLTVTATYGLLRYARRHEWWALLLALAALLAIENLRQFVFFILCWLMPLAFLLADRSGWRRKLLLALPLVLAIAFFNFGTNNEKFGTNFLTPKALTEAEWKRWLEERDAATGINEDSVKPPRDLETIVERSITYLPKGVFYVLFGPTPWEARSGFAQAVIPEMLAWYTLLAAALLGLCLTLRQSWRDLALPLAFSAAWVLALALTEGNTGNIFRHRSMFMPFVFLLSAVGLVWVWDRWQARRATRPAADGETEAAPLAGGPRPASGALRPTFSGPERE
jgi:hypothetical protein